MSIYVAYHENNPAGRREHREVSRWNRESDLDWLGLLIRLRRGRTVRWPVGPTERVLMLVYHRTAAAEVILRDGFRDSRASPLAIVLQQSGVWVADHPLDENEDARGDTLLAVEIPDHELVDHELVQNVGYREFLVPAAVLNQHDAFVVDQDA
jgi:hypothetical protein